MYTDQHVLSSYFWAIGFHVILYSYLCFSLFFKFLHLKRNALLLKSGKCCFKRPHVTYTSCVHIISYSVFVQTSISPVVPTNERLVNALQDENNA